MFGLVPSFVCCILFHLGEPYVWCIVQLYTNSTCNILHILYMFDGAHELQNILSLCLCWVFFLHSPSSLILYYYPIFEDVSARRWWRRTTARSVVITIIIWRKEPCGIMAHSAALCWPKFNVRFLSEPGSESSSYIVVNMSLLFNWNCKLYSVNNSYSYLNPRTSI